MRAGEALPTPENDIEATPSTVPRMRASNGRYTSCVTRHGEPIVDGRADTPALDRRLARTVVPSY